MSNNRYISAAEIGNYTFCPRAWALRKLDYKPDNRWELEQGIEYHNEVGEQEILKNSQSQPKQISLERKIKVLQQFIIFLSIIIISFLIWILLK